MIVQNEKLSTNLADLLNDASIDRVMAIDLDWNIIAWNKTSENTSGIKKEVIVGKHLLEIFPQIKEDYSLFRGIEMAFKGMSSFVEAKAGLFNRHYYENHFIPLRDPEQNILGVMNIMHDVSHRVKAENELQRLNAELREKYRQLQTVTAEMATFTSLAGNDLRDPIQRLYVSLELLVKQDAQNLTNSSKAILRRAQSSLNRINILLDDILKLATVNSFSLSHESVDLNAILQEVLKALHHRISEKGAIVDAADLPTINGSPQMVLYLFYNLLTNALKFQPERNIPHIEIASTEIVDPIEEKKFTVISFKDNGIGFDQAEADRIFKMFEKLEQKKYPGTGVGLTICLKIMEAHQGRITAEGFSGQGALFSCFFPHLREQMA